MNAKYRRSRSLYRLFVCSTSHFTSHDNLVVFHNLLVLNEVFSSVLNTLFISHIYSLDLQSEWEIVSLTDEMSGFHAKIVCISGKWNPLFAQKLTVKWKELFMWETDNMVGHRMESMSVQMRGTKKWCYQFGFGVWCMCAKVCRKVRIPRTKIVLA